MFSWAHRRSFYIRVLLVCLQLAPFPGCPASFPGCPYKDDSGRLGNNTPHPPPTVAARGPEPVGGRTLGSSIPLIPCWVTLGKSRTPSALVRGIPQEPGAAGGTPEEGWLVV